MFILDHLTSAPLAAVCITSTRANSAPAVTIMGISARIVILCFRIRPTDLCLCLNLFPSLHLYPCGTYSHLFVCLFFYILFGGPGFVECVNWRL